jgi:hypothetical protein
VRRWLAIESLRRVPGSLALLRCRIAVETFTNDSTSVAASWLALAATIYSRSWTSESAANTPRIIPKKYDNARSAAFGDGGVHTHFPKIVAKLFIQLPELSLTLP